MALALSDLCAQVVERLLLRLMGRLRLLRRLLKLGNLGVARLDLLLQTPQRLLQIVASVFHTSDLGFGGKPGLLALAQLALQLTSALLELRHLALPVFQTRFQLARFLASFLPLPLQVGDLTG